eukprot:XP_001705379.1 Hypothetical protein GL50803_88349 [Giardia lamblia ATCC 50803]
MPSTTTEPAGTIHLPAMPFLKLTVETSTWYRISFGEPPMFRRSPACRRKNSTSLFVHLDASLFRRVCSLASSVSRSNSSSRGAPGGSGRTGKWTAGMRGGVGFSKLGFTSFSVGSDLLNPIFSYRAETCGRMLGFADGTVSRRSVKSSGSASGACRQARMFSATVCVSGM